MKQFNVVEVEQLVKKILDKIKREQLVKKVEQLAVGQVIEQICAGQTHTVEAVISRKNKAFEPALARRIIQQMGPAESFV